MIKNFLTSNKPLKRDSHGGVGKIDLYEIWDGSDFESKIEFFDRVVVPPKSTIGFHQHGDNEEMYIILKGEGLMKIEEENVIVRGGDMILNPKGGKHGLSNNSESDIDILIIQVGV